MNGYDSKCDCTDAVVFYMSLNQILEIKIHFL